MAQAATQAFDKENVAPARSKRRIFIELTICYGLILLVIWTPRPWQKHLWWIAAVIVAIIAALSFNGLKPMGLRMGNIFRSTWIAGLALLLSTAAVVAAIQLHTLHLPNGGASAFVKTYWIYALWACVQQLLLQGFFLPRFMVLTRNPRNAALIAGVLFALAHLPNPILTPVTLAWGFAACLLFLHYRNLYPLAMAHAIVGITITISIPAPLDHNMRVGLGYLTYNHPAPNPTDLSKP